jgi:hypothetical protein
MYLVSGSSSSSSQATKTTSDRANCYRKHLSSNWFDCQFERMVGKIGRGDLPRE